MTCDAPVRECLEWHYAPHLAGAKYSNAGGGRIQARCPVCKSDRRALTVSAGDWRRTTWRCHNGPGGEGCDGAEVRAALLRAGIPAGCVPRGDGVERSRAELAITILTSGNHEHAAARLAALAVLRGHTRWPRGHELEQLASDAGVSRGSAYEVARKLPLPSPDHLSGTRSRGGAVKYPQVTTAFRGDEEVQPLDKVQPLDPEKSNGWTSSTAERSGS